METNRLKYFCTIVDSGSLTKAAEILNVSHSGLSKAMQVLQREVGFKIFLPKGRGLELTQEGRRLYENGRKILEILNTLKAQSAGAIVPLRIALPEVLALATSEPLSREWKGALSMEDLDAGEIEARVLNGQTDFGFTFVPFPHKDLEHLKVASVPLSSFCLCGRFRGIDPEQIPYVIPAAEMKENPLSLRIRDGWNPNLSRLTLYRANSLSIAVRMVQAGVCAIYIPEFAVAHLNQFVPKLRRLVRLDLPPSRRSAERTQRDIFLIKRATVEETKPMKTAVRIIRQVAKANNFDLADFAEPGVVPSRARTKHMAVKTTV